MSIAEDLTNNGGQVAWCCHRDCDGQYEVAQWAIYTNQSYDYTYSCDKHLVEMLDPAERNHVYYIFEWQRNTGPKTEAHEL